MLILRLPSVVMCEGRPLRNPSLSLPQPDLYPGCGFFVPVARP